MNLRVRSSLKLYRNQFKFGSGLFRKHQMFEICEYGTYQQIQVEYIIDDLYHLQNEICMSLKLSWSTSLSLSERKQIQCFIYLSPMGYNVHYLPFYYLHSHYFQVIYGLHPSLKYQNLMCYTASLILTRVSIICKSALEHRHLTRLLGYYLHSITSPSIQTHK